jgi:hypothetical protein
VELHLMPQKKTFSECKQLSTNRMLDERHFSRTRDASQYSLDKDTTKESEVK